MSTFRLIINLLRERLGSFLLILLISILLFLLTNIQPLIIKYLIDEILINQNNSILFKFIFVFAALGLMQIMVSILFRYREIYLTSNTIRDKRKQVFDKAFRLPAYFIANVRAGDFMYRTERDTGNVSIMISEIINIFTGVLSTLTVLAFLLYLDYRIALMSLILIPAYIIVAYYFNRVLKNKNSALAKRFSDVSEFIREKLSSVHSIKNLNCVDYVINKHTLINYQIIKDLIGVRKTRVNASWITSVFTITGQVLVIGMGSFLVVKGDITIGAFVAIFAYVSRFFGPLKRLVDGFIGFNQYIVSLERLEEVKDYPEEKTSGETPDLNIGSIRFENVSFAYETGNEVFSSLNGQFEKGKLHVIIGESGSGKTTLLNLLTGYADKADGKISIDNHSISDISINSVRDYVSVVEQDVFLFNESIKINLTLGEDISDDRIIDVCRKTGVDKIIEEKPGGIDYVVGDRGSFLSGGQKKRIAVARALLKQVSILLLDEPTADLDNDAKKALFDLLASIKDELTVLVITHDIYSVDFTDVLFYEIRKGKLINLKN